MKEGIFILVVSKREAKYLKTHGVSCGENGVSVTHSKHSGRTYYVAESKPNLALLEKYRKLITIATYCK